MLTLRFRNFKNHATRKLFISVSKIIACQTASACVLEMMKDSCQVKEKVCLVIIDGWGYCEESYGNAILNSRTPNMNMLMKNSLLIEASEKNVGLPDGQMGNSEVGHLHLGTGRISYHDMFRIKNEIDSGQIFQNENFVKACNRAKTVSGGRIHFVGLCSDGGVHAHIEHILSLIKSSKKLGVSHCYLHFIADGRDTSPTSGAGFVKMALDSLKQNGGTLSTVVGRFYAMDRDKKWDRIKVALQGFIQGIGTKSSSETIVNDIQASYAKGDKYTDEYLTSFVLGDSCCRIKDNDTIIFGNYRSDRCRQLVTSLTTETQFPDLIPKNLKIITMTQYNKAFTFDYLFGPEHLKNVLAEWLSVHNLKQLHVAETEKYAHVTFFLNGQIDDPFPLEERVLVPSPKTVDTYDLCPPMSVYQVSEKVVEGIRSNEYPFIVVNLAPPDMVGHVGWYYSAFLACEATDHAIGKIYQACQEAGFTLIVTSDHGNAEMMYTSEGGPHTAHTLNPVPLIVTRHHKLQPPSDRKPSLYDVAPTILHLMGLPKPPQMTGISLVV